MDKIRSATVSDAAAVRDIYSTYILETSVSFEMEVPTVEEMERRISLTLQNFPWLVFERDQVVLGYAYAGLFKSRPAYRWSAESTVYVKQGMQGQGIGKRLYDSLLTQLKDKGMFNVIGGITLPNEASVALHEGFGFKPVARFPKVGFKHGTWWDVGYWQLELEKPDSPT